jgi:hypothetical protein
MDSPGEYDDFIKRYNIAEFFLTSLRFAHQLECLFEKGSLGDTNDAIDYSPVTIMYCKLIEGLLKEYHISTYCRCFDDVASGLNRWKKGKKTDILWGEVLRLPEKQKQKLTIGSFTHPFDKEPDAVGSLAVQTGMENTMWQAHREMIEAVRKIRNPSAHGSKDHRISLAEKNEITRLLFKEGGFVRLIKIVR